MRLSQFFSIIAIAALAVACGSSKNGSGDAPVIATTTIDTATPGKSYQQQLAATGGQPPLTWSLDSVPPELAWLQIDPTTGKLSGTPPASIDLGASYSFTVTITDKAGHKVSQSLTLSIPGCTEGLKIACYTPSADTCLEGFQLCTSKKFGECQQTVPVSGSSDKEKCGPTCETCGAQADSCVNGKCQCGKNPACSSDLTCCNGKCVDVNTNPDYCGECNKACDNDRKNVQRICTAGTCTYPCAENFARCPLDLGQPDCLTAIDDSNATCGGCGNPCVSDPSTNSQKACVKGICTVVKCENRKTDCDGRQDNGCETDTGTDSKNCGQCGHDCMADILDRSHVASVSCEAGVCVLKGNNCSDGFINCSGQVKTGCETSTEDNCGLCDNPCKNVNQGSGTVRCARDQQGAPICSIKSCPAGFYDCNGNVQDGCETDLNSSQNCGYCGHDCSGRPNADMAVCGNYVTAQCKILKCHHEDFHIWEDCDGDGENGCEKNVNIDSDNCGKCGTVCSCLNGECQ